MRRYATLRALFSSLVFTSSLGAPFAHQVAFAGPEGGEVIGGDGTITYGDDTTTILQESDNLAIDWDSFDVGSDESVLFIQPDSDSIALNNILSNHGSTILGQIEANGHVILVNPNGVIFGAGSVVNAGGILASGLRIDPDAFMNGDYVFSAVDGSNGFVLNQGLINAAMGGSVALIGQQVENEGVISAQLGSVTLAAGKEAVVTFDADGLLGVTVTKAVLQEDIGVDAAVVNSGDISAESGQVLLTASVSQDIFSAAVNTGEIRHATSVVVDEDGSFTLSAGADVQSSGNINVSGESAGSVVVLGENVTVAGNIQADSATGSEAGWVELHSADTTILQSNSHITANAAQGAGGDIKVLGDRVGLVNEAIIDATGSTNGGQILIGGDYRGENPLVTNASAVVVSAGVEISADALSVGNAGRIILWGDEVLRFYGSISAQGFGEANGGFVETSASFVEVVGGVNVDSEEASNGEWLIDPWNINIRSALDGGVAAESRTPDAGFDSMFGPSDEDSVVLISTLLTALNSGSNIRIETEDDGAGVGNITLEDALDYSGVGDASLVLDAANNIAINGQISNSDSSSLDLTLIAAGDVSIAESVNTGGGFFAVTGVNFSNSGTVTTEGGSFLVGGTIDNSSGSDVFTHSPLTGGFISLGTISTGGGVFQVNSVDFTLGFQDNTPSGTGVREITTASISTGGGNFGLYATGAINIYGSTENSTINIDTAGGELIVGGDHDGDSDVVTADRLSTSFASYHSEDDAVDPELHESIAVISTSADPAGSISISSVGDVIVGDLDWSDTTTNNGGPTNLDILSTSGSITTTQLFDLNGTGNSPNNSPPSGQSSYITFSAADSIYIQATMRDSGIGTVDAIDITLTADSDRVDGGGILISSGVSLETVGGAFTAYGNWFDSEGADINTDNQSSSSPLNRTTPDILIEVRSSTISSSLSSGNLVVGRLEADLGTPQGFAPSNITLNNDLGDVQVLGEIDTNGGLFVVGGSIASDLAVTPTNIGGNFTLGFQDYNDGSDVASSASITTDGGDVYINADGNIEIYDPITTSGGDFNIGSDSVSSGSFASYFAAYDDLDVSPNRNYVEDRGYIDVAAADGGGNISISVTGDANIGSFRIGETDNTNSGDSASVTALTVVGQNILINSGSDDIAEQRIVYGNNGGTSTHEVNFDLTATGNVDITDTWIDNSSGNDVLNIYITADSDAGEIGDDTNDGDVTVAGVSTIWFTGGNFEVDSARNVTIGNALDALPTLLGLEGGNFIVGSALAPISGTFDNSSANGYIGTYYDDSEIGDISIYADDDVLLGYLDVENYNFNSVDLTGWGYAGTGNFNLTVVAGDDIEINQEIDIDVLTGTEATTNNLSFTAGNIDAPDASDDSLTASITVSATISSNEDDGQVNITFQEGAGNRTSTFSNSAAIHTNGSSLTITADEVTLGDVDTRPNRNNRNGGRIQITITDSFDLVGDVDARDRGTGDDADLVVLGSSGDNSFSISTGASFNSNNVGRIYLNTDETSGGDQGGADTFTLYEDLDAIIDAGSGDDIFNVHISLADEIDGGDGSDTYNINASGISLDINDTGVGASDTDALYAFDDDTNANIWTINGGTERLTNVTGNVDFLGIEHLHGGDGIAGVGGVDNFIITDNFAGQIFGGDGADTFTISANITDGDVTTEFDVQGEGGDDTFNIASADRTLSLDGGLGTDTLNLDDNSVNAYWQITGADEGGLGVVENTTTTTFGAIELVNGSDGGNDTFDFDFYVTPGDADSGIGNFAGTLDARDGDFDSVNLFFDEITNLSIDLTTFSLASRVSNAEIIRGDGDSSSITITGGASVGTTTTWAYSDIDTGSVSDGVNDGQVSNGGNDVQFVNIGGAVGNDADDVFTFTNDATVFSVDGADGDNEITGRDQNNRWSLGFDGESNPVGQLAQVIDSSTVNIYVTEFANVQTINGGAAADELVGRNQTNDWQITATNTGSVELQDGDDSDLVYFNGVETLSGNESVDNFTLTTNNIEITIYGGEGDPDTAEDVLYASNEDGNEWTIGADAETGTLENGAVVTFSEIENKAGGSGSDIYLVSTAGTYTLGFTGSFGGVSGIETIRNTTGDVDGFYLQLGAEAVANSASATRNVWDIDTSPSGGPINSGTITEYNVDTALNNISFENFEVFTGNELNDSFVVRGDNFNISIDASFGSDAVDLSQIANAVNVIANTTADVSTWSSVINAAEIIFANDSNANSLTFESVADSNYQWNIGVFTPIEIVPTGSNLDGIDDGQIYLDYDPDGVNTAIFSFVDFETVIGGAGNDVFDVTAVGSAITTEINGGEGAANAINGPDVDTAWTINYDDSVDGLEAYGTFVNGLAGGSTTTFDNINTVNAGSEDDTFTIASSNAALSITLNGGMGSAENNTLNFAGTINNYTVTLTDDGNFSGIGLGLSGITTVSSAGANNTLAFSADENMVDRYVDWQITDTNSGVVRLATVSGTGTTYSNETNFDGFVNLTGSLEDDLFTFTTGTDGLGGTTYGSLEGNIRGISAGDSSLTGSETNTIVGHDLASEWVVGSDNSITIEETDATVILDTYLSGSSFINELQGSNTAADQFIIQDENGFAGTIVGGTGTSDTLTVNQGAADTDTLWDLNGTTTVSRRDISGATPVVISTTTFSEIESITGGTRKDIFNVYAAGFIGSVNAFSASDVDELDVSNLSGDDYDVNFTAANTLQVSLSSGGAAIISVSNVEQVTGSSSGPQTNITLVAPTSGNNTWTISDQPASSGFDGQNDGQISNASLGIIYFENIGNLEGSAANDAFTIDSANNGSFIGNIDGGSSGTNTLTWLAGGNTWELTSAYAGEVNTTTVFSNITNVVGAASDSLLGLNQINDWRITGANSGYVGLYVDGVSVTDAINFSGIGSLTGNVQADYFTRVNNSSGTDGSITGTITGGGAGATDTLIYESDATQDVSWVIGDSTDSVGSINAFVGFEAYTGGAGNDTFTIHSAAWVATINGAGNGAAGDSIALDETDYAGNATWAINGDALQSVGLITFSNIENAHGASGIDTFNISGESVASLFGRDGNDIFNVLSTDLITINLNGGDGVSGDTLNGATRENTWVIGGATAQANTLNYDSVSSERILFSNIENFVGSTDIDNFSVQESGIANVVRGSADGVDDTSIDSIAIVRSSGTTNWTVSGNGAGSIADDYLDNFYDIERLTGGSTTDIFTFTTAGSYISNLIDGAGGANDQFILNSHTSGVVIELGSTVTAANPDASNTLINLHLNNIENITATDSSSGADEDNNWLVNNDTRDFTWLINQANAGSFDVTNDTSNTFNAVTFNNFGRIVGSDTGIDSFVFSGTGAISNEFVGGAGVDDSASFSALAVVNITLGSSTTPTINFSGVERVIGNGSNSTLTVASGTNDWSITGVNDGSVSQSGVEVIRFEDFNYVVGGTGIDTFTFENNTASITGSIHGGTNTDVLDTIERTNAADIQLMNDASERIDGRINIQSVESIVDLSSATNSLYAAASGNYSWTINNVNAGYVGDVAAPSLSFIGIASITGNDNVDVFNLAAAGSISGLNGLGGADDFNLAGTVSNVSGGDGSDFFSIDSSTTLALSTLQIVGDTSSYNGVDDFGDELVIGFDVSTTWELREAGNDTVGQIQFVGMETLRGNNSATFTDTFNVGNQNVEIIDGRNGNDNFEVTTSNAIALQLIGGGNNDTLTAADIANDWQLNISAGTYPHTLNDDIQFTQFEILVGGTAADEFILNSETLTGVSIDGGVGAAIDTLTAAYNASALWTIQNDDIGTAGIVETNEVQVGSNTISFTNVETINAVDGSSAAIVDTFDINAQNEVTIINARGGSDIFNVAASIGTLNGGDHADIFNIENASVTVASLDGDDGSDTLTISYADAGVTADWNIDATPSVEFITNYGEASANTVGALSDFDVDVINASSFTDVVAISGDNFTSFSANGGDDQIMMSGGSLTTINGDAGDDEITITGGTVANINGGADADTITTSVNVANVNGNAGNDTLAIISDSLTTWEITGEGEGNLEGDVDITNFSGFENLTGGEGSDHFDFMQVGAYISGTINGGSPAVVGDTDGEDNNSWNDNSNDVVNLNVDPNTNIFNDGVIVLVDGVLTNDAIRSSLAEQVPGVDFNTHQILRVANVERVDAPVASDAIADALGGTDSEVNHWIVVGFDTNVAWSYDSTINNLSLVSQESGANVAGSRIYFRNFGSVLAGNGDVSNAPIEDSNISGLYVQGSGNYGRNYANDDGFVYVEIDERLIDVVGNGASTVLVIPGTSTNLNGTNTWTINGSNSGSLTTSWVNDDGDTVIYTLTFTDVNMIVGGAGDDNFVFTGNGELTGVGSVDLFGDEDPAINFDIGSSIDGGSNGLAGDTIDTTASTLITGLTFGLNETNTQSIEISRYNGVSNLESAIAIAGRDNVIDVNNIEIITSSNTAPVTLLGGVDSSIAYTWNLSAAVSGNLQGEIRNAAEQTLITFNDIYHVTGGATQDRFNVASLGLNQNVFDGGEGEDTINLRLVSSALDAVLYGELPTNLADVTDSANPHIAGFETVLLPVQANTVTAGGDLANTWTITDSNTGSVQLGAGVGAFTVAFDNAANLVGGANIDVFNIVDVVDGDGALITSGDLTGSINAGAQPLNTNDVVNITASGDRTYQLSVLDVDGRVINTGNAVLDLVGVEEINANATSNNTLNGLIDSENTWLINAVENTLNGIVFSNIENIVGGNVQDNITFNGSYLTGLVDGGSNEADAVDTLNLVGNISGVSLHIGNRVTDDINVIGVENVTSSVDIPLVADNVVNTWAITGVGSGTLNTGFEFNGFMDLVGGTSVDNVSFVLPDTFDYSQSIVNSLNGGANPDTGTSYDVVDFAGWSDALMVTLDSTYTNANLDVALNNFEEIQANAAYSNILVGATGDNTWTIDSENGGDINNVVFAGFQNLIGRTGDDSFVFTASGSLDGSVVGGAHVNGDVVDVSALSVVNIVISDSEANGYDEIERYRASGTNATLTAPNVRNEWAVDGAIIETINGEEVRWSTVVSGSDEIQFVGFDSLVGGSAVDIFTINYFADVSEIDARGGNDTFNITVDSASDIDLYVVGNEGALDQINVFGGGPTNRLGGEYRVSTSGNEILSFEQVQSDNTVNTFELTFNTVENVENDVYTSELVVNDITNNADTITIDAQAFRLNDLSEIGYANSLSLNVDAQSNDAVLIDGNVTIASTFTVSNASVRGVDETSVIDANTAIVFNGTQEIGVSASERLNTETASLSLNGIDGDVYIAQNGGLTINALTTTAASVDLLVDGTVNSNAVLESNAPLSIEIENQGSINLSNESNRLTGALRLINVEGQVSLANSSAINLREVTAQSLELTAALNISDSGVIMVANETEIYGTDATDVNFDSEGNNFGEMTIHSANNVIVNDDVEDITLTANQVLGSLRVDAVGDIRTNTVVANSVNLVSVDGSVNVQGTMSSTNSVAINAQGVNVGAAIIVSNNEIGNAVNINANSDVLSIEANINALGITSGDVVLAGQSVTQELLPVISGENITITAQEGVVANTINANGYVGIAGEGVTLNGNITVSQAEGSDAVEVSAGNGELFVNGSISALGELSGNVSLDAQNIRQTNNANIRGGNVTLAANQSIYIAESIEALNTFTATAGDTFEMNNALVDDAISATNLNITTINDMNLRTLNALDSMTLISEQGNINFLNNVSAFNNIAITAQNGELNQLQNAQLLSTEGDILLTANSQQLDGLINASSGTVDLQSTTTINLGGTLEAQSVIVNSGQNTNMSLNSAINAESLVDIASGTNLVLSSVSTSSEEGMVVLNVGGSVVDNNGDATNFTTNTLVGQSQTGFGSRSGDTTEYIETSVANVDLRNTTGVLGIQNDQALLVSHLLSNGRVDVVVTEGDLTIDNLVDEAPYNRSLSDALTAGGIINANYMTGTLNVNVQNGSLLATGPANNYDEPDLVANDMIIRTSTSFGSDFRPLMVYARTTLFIGGDGYLPQYAFQTQPSEGLETDGSLAKNSSLLIGSSDLVLEVESVDEVDPAVFTEVRNYSFDNISILMPRDQRYEDDDDEYNEEDSYL